MSISEEWKQLIVIFQDRRNIQSNIPVFTNNRCELDKSIVSMARCLSKTFHALGGRFGAREEKTNYCPA